MDPTSTSATAKKPQFLPRSFTYHNHRPAAKPLWDNNKKKDPVGPAVVLYTTSLRGIRRTHHDCCALRSILRGFRVAVDERDVSMHAAYRRELQALLGGGGGGKPPPPAPPFSLPQLFVGGRHVGGAEEVRRLLEAGDLGRVLDGVPRADPTFVCGGCGGARFAPCSNCSGSRKVYVEEEGRMRRCEECNENGLVQFRRNQTFRRGRDPVTETPVGVWTCFMDSQASTTEDDGNRVPDTAPDTAAV